MAEAPSSSYELVTGNHWSVTANKAFTGVKTGLTIPFDIFPDILRNGNPILVEGISVMFFRVGGTAVISPNVGMHTLSSWTMPAVNLDRHSWHDLNIALRPDHSTDNIDILATTANLDIMTMSAWGQFIDLRVEPDETPVDIRRISIFKK